MNWLTANIHHLVIPFVLLALISSILVQRQIRKKKLAGAEPPYISGSVHWTLIFLGMLGGLLIVDGPLGMQMSSLYFDRELGTGSSLLHMNKL